MYLLLLLLLLLFQKINQSNGRNTGSIENKTRCLVSTAFWVLAASLCWQARAFCCLLPHSIHQRIFMKLFCVIHSTKQDLSTWSSCEPYDHMCTCLLSLQCSSCFHLTSSDCIPKLSEYVGIQRQILPYGLQSQVSRRKVCLKYLQWKA